MDGLLVLQWKKSSCESRGIPQSVKVASELEVYDVRGVCLSRGVLLPLREHRAAWSPDSAPMFKALYNGVSFP